MTMTKFTYKMSGSSRGIASGDYRPTKKQQMEMMPMKIKTLLTLRP